MARNSCDSAASCSREQQAVLAPQTAERGRVEGAPRGAHATQPAQAPPSARGEEHHPRVIRQRWDFSCSYGPTLLNGAVPVPVPTYGFGTCSTLSRYGRYGTVSYLGGLCRLYLLYLALPSMSPVGTLRRCRSVHLSVAPSVLVLPYIIGSVRRPVRLF